MQATSEAAHSKYKPLAHYSALAVDALTARPASTASEHARIAAQLAEVQASLAAAIDWVDDCGIKALEYVDSAIAQWDNAYAATHDAEDREACAPSLRGSM